MNKLSSWLILATVTTLLFFLTFLSFSDKAINKRIIESDQTMLLTDMMRHTFKASVLTERAFVTYQLALQEKDPARLVRSIEYLEAAIGFMNIGYIRNEKLKAISEPIIYKTIEVIETKRFDLKPQELVALHSELREVQKEIEAFEKNLWIDFQQNYVRFQSNEARLQLFYQYLFLLVLFFSLIAAYMLYRQRQTYKEVVKKDRQLEQLAFFDAVTGVMSRKAIEMEIEKLISRSKRYHQTFTVVMLDLDDFKRINDVSGHAVGDELLKKVTARLKQHIREMDYIGRIGGDEFLLILEDTTTEELKVLLERILDSMKQSFHLRSSEEFVQASFGAVEFPLHAENLSDLLKYADIAMYSAKEKGKSRYEIFDQSMKNRIHETASQEQSIRKAIENREFEIYLQPQIDFKNKTVFGVEALCRWNHPERGIVPPYEFIPFIENGIQIIEFHEWLLHEVARLQKRWQRVQELSDLKISLNLSIRYLSRPNFSREIVSLVDAFQIDLTKVEFEITEYSLMDSASHVKKEMTALTHQGFKFNLDDFGTGYSSITFLNDFPVNMIKIDKQFIDEIDEKGSRDEKLVNTILTIAKDLNIRVIAEGVETEPQANFLLEKGCALQQGYLYSKPTPVQEFEKWHRSFTSSNGS